MRLLHDDAKDLSHQARRFSYTDTRHPSWHRSGRCTYPLPCPGAHLKNDGLAAPAGSRSGSERPSFLFLLDHSPITFIECSVTEVENEIPCGSSPIFDHHQASTLWVSLYRECWTVTMYLYCFLGRFPELTLFFHQRTCVGTPSFIRNTLIVVII